MLPDRPPFTLRARVLTPLAAGGTRYEAGRRGSTSTRRGGSRRSDRGRATAAARPSGHRPAAAASCCPGMVDLHVHLPQLPNAGVGAGLDLLTWLERYIFPLERAFDEAAAERLAPLRLPGVRGGRHDDRRDVRRGVRVDSLDAAFRAAEAHGIRAVIGKVMMDRGSYDDTLAPDASSRRASASPPTCARAGTGGTTAGCGTRSRRASRSVRARHAARVGRAGGARPAPTGRRMSSEDRDEIARGRAAVPRRDRLPRRLRPRRRPRAAHDPRPRDPPVATREVARARRDGLAHRPLPGVATCSSPAGAMPLARYRAAGIRVGLGSDVAGGPELSIFASMRAGAYTQSGLRVSHGAATGAADAAGTARLAAAGHARGRAGARAWRTRSARSSRARRPT